jgi:hypothetical protein
MARFECGGRRWNWTRVAVACATAAALARGAAAQVADPGYGLEELTIAPGSAFLGGFEVLANGNWALYDGTSVVELSSVDGSFVRSLFTPQGFTFGAFLTRSPDGATLYFGDSSANQIWAIDLASLQALPVLQVNFPFDLAFDPQGRAFVTWSPGFFQGSHVSLCDFANGTLDDVVDSPEASGPLAFDADGNLWTALPDFSSFPPLADATELIQIAKSDLDAAVGPTSYDALLAPVHAQLDGAYGIALDDAGDIVVSDSNYGTLIEVDLQTGAERQLAFAGARVGFLFLRFVDGAHGVLEPWQPADGGELLAIRSDFFSLNSLDRVHAARPELSLSTGPVVPPGLFDLDVTGATQNGLGLLFLSDGLATGELELRNRTWPAPLFFDLDFVNVQLLPIVLDVDGAYHETLDNPGLGGVTIAAQLLTAGALSGPWYGTSNALSVTLQ